MSKFPGRKELEALLREVRQETTSVDAIPGAALAEFRHRALALAEKAEPAHCGRRLARFLARVADTAVRHLVESAAAGSSLRLCWVAVGGYGRGFMSPGSTVRLIALHTGQDPDEATRLAAESQDVLRRAGYRTAAVAHTPDEVIALMRRDYLSAVALLGTRRLSGSTGLYRQLQSAVADRFLPGCWGTLGEEVLAEAMARRDPFTSSPYCTEPNLKDGAGCLRDVGALETLNECLSNIPAIEELHAGRGEEAALLEGRGRRAPAEARELLLRVRNALHLTQGDGPDLLHRGAQQEVAERLGFGAETDPAAALMQEVFLHTGRVSRLLRSFHERFLHLHRVAWRRTPQPPRRRLESDFVEVEGRIYSAASPPFGTEEKLPRMMQLFRLSQRRHLSVSQQLLDQVSENLDAVTARSRTDPAVGQAFLDLLGGSVGVAERISRMRECGLLQAYLPELRPLVHRIHPEAAGDLTLDEHAVEALRTIDELGQTKEPSELAQRHTLEQVERTDLLRLAILLHDLELAGEPRDSAEAGGDVADRLGLNRRDREELVFLLSNRDLLWGPVSDPDVPPGEAAGSLAKVVREPRRLRSLYLLHYAHARARGKLAWFAWRDARLFELFQSVVAVLVPDYAPFATAEHFDREFLAAARRVNRLSDAEHFVQLLPQLYKTEVTAEEALSHLQLVERLDEQPAATAPTIRSRDARVWVCTSDLPARFCQIAGVFTYNGLDILSATAFTLEDGTVLDRFVVQMKDRPINPDPTFWDKIENDLVLSIEGALDIRAELRRRAEQAAGREPMQSRRSISAVHFENEPGVPFTTLEIVARDRPGILFEVADALGSVKLNIEFARIRTRGELVRDVFCLTDAETGRPVRQAARLDEVRERLLSAIG